MKGAHQTGFGVKLDTTTKYNRLKNITDKGSAVRRGECLFRKRKMAAQRNAVRVCLCVRRTTPSTDSETGKTKKIYFTHYSHNYSLISLYNYVTFAASHPKCYI